MMICCAKVVHRRFEKNSNAGGSHRRPKPCLEQFDQDIYIERCRSKCAEDNESCLDNCSSDYIGKFDVGLFFFNLIGEYIKQDGKVWEVKACYGDDSCDQ